MPIEVTGRTTGCDRFTNIAQRYLEAETTVNKANHSSRSVDDRIWIVMHCQQIPHNAGFARSHKLRFLYRNLRFFI